MKFRKKPVVVEATQWFKNGDHPAVVMRNSCTTAKISPGITYVTKVPVIETLEGEHIVTPGDWIIEGVAGGLYPCKPDIFEAAYEAVHEDQH